MQDDLEYFTGENIELQSKVKDVCLQNAKLKLQLAELVLQAPKSQLMGTPQAVSPQPLELTNPLTIQNDEE